MNTIDLVTQKMQFLPLDKQDQVLDFVEFLMVKYQQGNAKKSAEQRAIERLKDVEDADNPNKWETMINIDDEIDVESSLENLRKRGYKVKISSQS
ncbi:DUF2281 domain-containing protein [Aphanothece sacrum]|uniref:Uncharacterized protein n=1 Tax=Aphanothece sacrum FPU1 TaxID=1920663 RepID=A0A401IIQ2_APHSA|nr:DUF2281 domain-containing protein [Aphanothece sacrum]GBF81050.1 hypothetical protein AsFPU1_2459 [Aphanothece sacrum FPU1]GBF85451.1 hypothetical protein AsFPU3_2510 [Aphanothece sacrum FPU3]